LPVPAFGGPPSGFSPFACLGSVNRHGVAVELPAGTRSLSGDGGEVDVVVPNVAGGKSPCGFKPARSQRG